MNANSSKIARRQFLKASLAGTGLMAASGLTLGQSAPREFSSSNPVVPKAILGRTGIEVSKFGIGCAPFQAKEIDSDHVRVVFDRALELGVNYLDVAPNYGNPEVGFSEVKMGPALQGIRDRFFLVTKTEEPSRDGTWRLLEQSMKRLQTDHIDLVHIHNFGHEPRFPDLKAALGKQGVLGALQEAKEQQVIRFIGASGHLHPSRFHAALDTGEIDVLMNAVNFVVQHVYDFEHKVWARARRENVGLVAMKVLGGARGEGFRIPKAHYESSIRYALSIGGVCMAVIGIKDTAELEQASSVVAQFKPLSEGEAHRLSTGGLQLAGTSEWKSAYGTPLT